MVRSDFARTRPNKPPSSRSTAPDWLAVTASRARCVSFVIFIKGRRWWTFTPTFTPTVY